MQSYFRSIGLILLLNLSSLYSSHDLQDMINSAIEPGKALIQNPNRPQDGVIKGFQKAILALEALNSNDFSSIREEVANMYAILEQIATQTQNLADQSIALAIRLASQLEVAMKEELLEKFNPNQLFPEAMENVPNQRPSDFHARINYYDLLNKAISKRSFYDKQRDEGKRLMNMIMEKLKKNKVDNIVTCFRRSAELTESALTEADYQELWEMAEDYFLRVIDDNTDNYDTREVILQMAVLIGKLHNEPNRHLLYWSKQAAILLKAGKRANLHKLTRFDLLNLGLNSALSTNYKVTVSDLSSFIEVFKSLAANAPLPTQTGRSYTNYNDFTYVNKQVMRYKRTTKKLIEADQRIFSEEARALLHQLYPTLFEVVDQLPKGYFLANDSSDDALAVWQQYQEDQLKDELKKANQNNEHSNFVGTYQKALKYISNNLDQGIQPSSYQRLLYLVKGSDDQQPTLQVTNTEELVKALEDSIESGNFEEEQSSEIAMKNMYLFFVGQLGESVTGYNGYLELVDEYREDINNFIEDGLYDRYDYLLPMRDDTGSITRENDHSSNDQVNVGRGNAFNPWQHPGWIVTLLCLAVVGLSSACYTLYQKQKGGDKAIQA